MPDPLSYDIDLLRKIVGAKTELADNGFGICPFHPEATPSFNIFRSTQNNKALFHCFSCQAGGDIFDFVLLTEGLGFRDARRFIMGEPNAKSNPSVPVSIAKPSPLHPGATSSRLSGGHGGIQPLTYCERDCPKYWALREDYYRLLDEVAALREELNKISQK